jgi:D-glycero-D-manno-heptose 1,7-bisphosphate phosphatase
MRQAVILVGGKGTRLGAAARDTPKPLMPIAGDVRFLDYLIDNIARHGLRDILLIAGHLGAQVAARYDGARFREATVSVVREPEPAGTAGALRHVADRLDETFLMSNGDSFFDINYLALAQGLRLADMARLALRHVPDAGRYGRVTLDGERIAAFHEKDAAWRGDALISGGVYVLRRSVLDLIDRTPLSIETDIFPALCAKGAVSGACFEGYFLDIGLPETLGLARAELPPRLRRATILFDRDGTLNRDDGYTYKIADLHFLPGAIAAVRAANDAGALAIVVTNQSGIARGKYRQADMEAFHAAMQTQLNAHGAHIDAFYHCPYHEDAVVPALARANHPDRKPNAGLLRRALLEWPVDPARTLMVGDHARDVDAAHAIGIRGAEVKPGELEGVVTRALADMAQPTMTDRSAELIRDRAARARAWLFDHALPVWATSGFDRASGCFEERLDLAGQPVALPRRVRVQARQTFVYAMAGKLGWDGPWRERVEAGARLLLDKGLRAGGGTNHLLAPDGGVADTRADLYDAAFVAFALAHAAMALSQSELAARGTALIDWIKANWSHPEGGFREGEIVTPLPRRQNPHMHLLEALLALHEATGEARHLADADRIAALFETRFVSDEWGALLEYFDERWRPASGRDGFVTEPGHQFEWAWLIDRLHRRGGRDVRALARRIQLHGEVYGVDPLTGFVADEVWAEGDAKTSTGRFWPSTERIKANVAWYERTRDPNAAAAAAQAFDVIMQYCDVPTPGLWRDRRLPDGSFIDEPAPASSFYHVMLAFAELIRLADALD